MVDLPLAPEDVNEIVAILDGSTYDRLDVTTSRFRLRVARDGDGWTQEWDFQDETQSLAKATSDPTLPTGVEALAVGLAAINAPLPGTFYRAPQPGAPPFVEVGDEVDLETVVGIVETMKLMNPVHAGVKGKIVAILSADGEMVDGAQPLMHIAVA